MEVILDGVRNFPVAGEHPDLLSVIRAVSDSLEAQGRALMSVTVDGRMIDRSDLSEAAVTLQPGTVAVLELTSEDMGVMVATALAQLRENLPELPAACRGMAEVFHGETPAEGYEPFRKLAEIWEFVKNQERLVVSALNLDLSTLTVDGITVEQMHRELNGFLEEAIEALTNNDNVLLGDLLEYELAPRAEKEMDIVALLEQQHAAGSASQ